MLMVKRKGDMSAWDRYLGHGTDEVRRDPFWGFMKRSVFIATSALVVESCV